MSGPVGGGADEGFSTGAVGFTSSLLVIAGGRFSLRGVGVGVGEEEQLLDESNSFSAGAGGGGGGVGSGGLGLSQGCRKDSVAVIRFLY